MWQRIARPDWLIFLDVTPETQRVRVARSDWSDELMRIQQRRLAHARQHADLILSTDHASAAEVLCQVTGFLTERGLPPAGG